MELRQDRRMIASSGVQIGAKTASQQNRQVRSSSGGASVTRRMAVTCRSRWSNELSGGIMDIIWTIIIGFVAGLIARFLHPGASNEPSGFILTALLGIIGAFVATFLGQAIGWYKAGEGAGLIGAVVGAIIVLVIWGMIARRRAKVWFTRCS